ncbi:MAG: hypothetical protein B6U97_01360 [Candidatus Altiarchaeales archaeon ex4484_96]|nr:MAG: hypothetical protein B6U97_01360 [Candidatus Altiarchaeales archaeon ex4484_96]
MRFRLLFFVLLLVASACAEEINIEGIDVELSDDGNDSSSYLIIEPGQMFYVHTTLKKPDQDASNIVVYLRIYIDDVLVYDKGKSIDTDELIDYELIVESERFLSVWDETFMGYDCSVNEVKVEAYGDIPNSIDSAEIEIEGVKFFDEVEVVPPEPDKNDLVFVYVEDWFNESEDEGDEGGEPLEDAFVKLINLGENQMWDKTDDFDGFETDNDGFVKFTLSRQREFQADPYGKYMLFVLEKKSGDEYGVYCRFMQSFTIGHYINISIEPEKPKEGEPFKVEITDDNNQSVPFVLLTVSGPDKMVLQTTTDENGVAEITLNESGIHSINALREGCEECANSVSKWFEVEGRGRLYLEIEPVTVEVGKNVVMVVTNEEKKNIRNALVYVTLPNGSKVGAKDTNTYGLSSYSPRFTGEYLVSVEKEGYKSASKGFTAQNSFLLDLPYELRLGESYNYTLRNQLNEPVDGALVLVEKLNISRLNLSADRLYEGFKNYTPQLNESSPYRKVSSGETGTAGSFNLSLDMKGFYLITFSKMGYANATRKVMGVNKLIAKLSSEEIKIGESVTVSVYDELNNPLDAVISITSSSKVVEIKEGSVLSYKPSSAGDYLIKITQAGYAGDGKNLTVLPYPVELDLKVEGIYLVINAKSQGKPLEDTKIEIITPDNKRVETHTDEDGIVELNLDALDRKGNFTIRLKKKDYETIELKKEITEWGSFNVLGLVPWFMGGVVLAVVAFLGIRIHENKKNRDRMKRLRRIRRRT